MAHLKNSAHRKKDKRSEKQKFTITTKRCQLATFMKIKWNVLVNLYCIDCSEGSFFEKFHDIYGTFYIKGRRRQITTYYEIAYLQ
jgi:hypothetical protein